MKTCKHPPMRTFIAFQGKNGAKVWRCSHCGKEDVWREGWNYFGSIECRICMTAGMEAVFCSDGCAKDFTPSDPRLALEMAKASKWKDGQWNGVKDV